MADDYYHWLVVAVESRIVALVLELDWHCDCLVPKLFVVVVECVAVHYWQQ